MSHQSQLLRKRRFLPLFITQFLGALNDNVLKNALVVLLTYQAAQWTRLSPGVLANLAAGIFILPFFVFSATAGQLADKFDKAKLARLVKTLEIGIVLMGGLGFTLHSFVLLMAMLFLLGMHSTLFGPVKYAILPQHLEENELVGGNALIEACTFVAILLGTIIGGLIAGEVGGTALITATGLAIAIGGFLASLAIPPARPPAPDLVIQMNPIVETWRNISYARENRTVFLSILGISWLWLYGALFLIQFPAYSKEVLNGSETVVTLLLATFTLGTGLGSLLCERLSQGKLELGLVPFGSLGLTFFGLDFAFASPDAPALGAPIEVTTLLTQAWSWRLLADLAGLGIFGGFFVVPLYALVQQRSAPEHRARIIAANNIANAFFMVIGAAASAILLGAGLSIAELFAVAAIANAAVAIYIYRLVPEFLLRFIVWLLIHSVYRLRVEGGDNVPEEGAAIIVCNHVSFVDALVITAGCRRPIRFVMDHRIFKIPILRLVFRETRAIPIAPAKEDAVLLELGYGEIAQALDAGELIGIFPEGKITNDGKMSPFRPGIERILARNPVPVVPMALRGLWGSFFSRQGGAALRRSCRRGIFSRVELVAGPAIPPARASAERLQAAVSQLRGELA